MKQHRPIEEMIQLSEKINRTALLLVLCFASTVHSETLIGHPRVVDADTLSFGKEKVRIDGIDAPEMRQQCKDASGAAYACGKVAMAALWARIGPDGVTCEGDSRDRYQRLIGFCFFADGTDMNAWIVRQGYALAYRKYSTAYIWAEDAAKAERLGIWAGEFVPPWDWRRGKRLPVEDIGNGNR